MPDYRWGIFLADRIPVARIACGDDYGKPVWQEVPGEHSKRAPPPDRDQGDTDRRASSSSRHLGRTCPSLYDLRNLFQSERGGRASPLGQWLPAPFHFGRDGRERPKRLLSAASGDPEKPRILGAFNPPIETWLSFFMFTYFTDRDGKYQCSTQRERFRSPARTTRFMLTERSAPHVVGESGVMRMWSARRR
jgi:benzoyl-CoA 2,3-dioxygenase component B